MKEIRLVGGKTILSWMDIRWIFSDVSRSAINALQCPAGSCAWRRLVISSAEQLRGLTTAAWSHDVFLLLRSSALYNISENKHQEIPRKFLLKIP